MHTTNADIKSLVQDITKLSQSTFQGRCTAVYVMGSLARGGFSEVASDIDIGLILEGPLNPQDETDVDRILSEMLERNAAVRNKVSLFWGSIDSIDGVVEAGRYPPFDRLDLIDHALLLAGRDVRSQLKRPSKRELVVSSAEFALDRLDSDQVLEKFHDCGLLASQGTVTVTKRVLFPARFIYMVKAGEIAGNEASYKYYADSFSGPDAELVSQAYHWRMNALPDELDEVVDRLEQGLAPLYCRFIDIYVECLDGYEEAGLSLQLDQWRDRITSR